jgi:hypothetical protein
MLLRLARAVLVIGAVGSLVLLFLHGRPSVFLLLLFTGWVLAPFVGLGLADRMSSRWPASAQRTLYYVMLVVSIGSLAVYAYDVATAAGRAFFFVVTAMFAWAVILVVLPIAVVAGRRSAPRI